jgi:glycosyltransferase involved in cell wall biosynthesis
MRIGIDCRKLFDFGIGTYVRGLVRGLAELDAPEEYVLFAPSRALEQLPARFERIAIDVPNYTIRELFAFRGARLDLFHAPDINVPFVGCPTVVTIHDLIRLHYPPPNPIARAYVRFMTRRALANSRVLLTVSEASRREIDAPNVVVTPNGIDERFFAPHDTPRGDYFLFVGNDKPHKNVARLIEAARELRLVLAGGAFTGGLGFVSDEKLLALYRGAIALVMPSLEEGFGLPAAEAMACGTPVITSNAPALVEVTGDAALHVEATSVDAIRNAMLRVRDDETLRDQLARRGRERARQFTWRRCAELTREAYLAAGSSPRAARTRPAASSD